MSRITSETDKMNLNELVHKSNSLADFNEAQHSSLPNNSRPVHDQSMPILAQPNTDALIEQMQSQAVSHQINVALREDYESLQPQRNETM